MNYLQKTIDEMVEFTLCIGSLDCGYDCINIKKKSSSNIKVNVVDKKSDYLGSMTEEDFEKFKKKLFKYVKNWKLTYNNVDVLDGIKWSVDIVGTTTNISFSGCNKYPLNWRSFFRFAKGSKLNSTIK